jgi:glutamine amidotransferase
MKKTGDYIAIIDYQVSNLYSVKHACDAIGIESVITSDPEVLLGAKAAILPGVGAFGDAMKNLEKFRLIHPIKNFIASKRKFMGVCLGMQLLFEESSEFGTHKGLQIIKGDVVKFPSVNSKKQSVKIPQIGWNTIYPSRERDWKQTPFFGMKKYTYMYFVHSFYVRPKEKKVILSNTTYEGVAYCSAILEKNVFAVQFHPEKSGKAGLEIYKKWVF